MEQHGAAGGQVGPGGQVGGQEGGQYLLTPAHSHPDHFTRGSLIQLASGKMKKVEELETEDFLTSALDSPEVSIDQSTLVRLEPAHHGGLAVLSFTVGKKNLQVSYKNLPIQSHCFQTPYNT